MMEALIRHGTLDYTFEINESQADLARCFPQNSRFQVVENLRRQIPWAMWMDGCHPRFPHLDAVRDWLYRELLGGWSVAGLRYGQRVKRIRAEVCHVPFEGVPFWPRQFGLVYTQTVHDFQPEYLPELQHPQTLKSLASGYQVYRRASAVCVLGETCKADAIKYARLNPDRVFVTPYGLWEVLPPSAPEFQQQLRERFQLPPSFIFYPAPTRVQKNHARLVRALAALKKKGLRISMVTTGKQQPYYDELHAIICDLGMEEDVIFTDFVDLLTLYALYDMATAVVLPTLFEGATGIPLLEALSKGKAIAAARVCEIPNTLGDSGLLFDPYSEAEIAAAVQRLWESPSLRAELSRKAQNTNRGRSWEQFAKATEAAFRYANDHPND